MQRPFFKLLLPLALAGALFLIWQGKLPSPLSGSGVWRYSPGNDSEIAVDSRETGTLLLWRNGGRSWVKQPAGPLSITLASGEELTFRSLSTESPRPGSLLLHGEFTGAARSTAKPAAEPITKPIPARIRYEGNEGGDELTVSIEAEALENLAVGQWDYPLPLKLNRHKRVYLRGDHHLSWDERYTYQFHLNTGFAVMPFPDVTEWRWFTAEQITPEAYRFWKAESDDAAPIVMHDGQRMAPFLQVYDQRGGVTAEYPQLTQGARRGLQVDASGGATIHVGLRTPSSTEQPVPSPLHQRHEIRFSLHQSAEALHAKRAALDAAFTPSAPIPTELEESPQLREAPMQQGPVYVSGGYPFAKGTLHNARSIAVQQGDRQLPVQAEPLGYWPDGSIKWAHLTFPITPDSALAEMQQAPPAARVTLRNGHALPLQITPSGPDAPAPAHALQTRLKGDGSQEIVNGAFTFRFSKGTDWMMATYHDGPLLSAPPRALLRFRRDAERLLPFARQASGGANEEQLLAIESVTLEEAGPLRAVVKLEGLTSGHEPTRIILRATLLAGRPEITFSHTAEFRFKDPRQTFLSAMLLEFPLAGLATKEGGIVQETCEARWSYGEMSAMRDEGSPETGWLDLPMAHGLRFQGGLRQMAQTAPKALTFRDGVVRFELWPEAASPMDVRRYSNRPHPGQGESTDGKPDWVTKEYYPHSPFEGISRTHELRLAFQPDGSITAPTLTAQAADLESPPLLYPGWETALRADVVLPVASQDGWSEMWEARENLTRFWLYHRALYRWYGFWHFGDFRHRFREGYGWNTSPEALAQALSTPELTLPTDAPRFYDYQPATDWAYDNGRWGWSNTEGLPNLFLQQEYLRTGNRTVYFAAEALARHSRDVIVRHEGPWLGVGTRHGVQPWSDGNHEERQITTTEYRLHYFLSGDTRTRDVTSKLYRLHYSRTPSAHEATHTGRLGGLFFHHELTGAPEEAEQLRKTAAAFVAPEGKGIYVAPHLSFPGPQIIGAPDALNASRMFFSCYGGLNYLLEIQKTLDDPSLKEGLISMATDVIHRTQAELDDPLYILPVVAFAARHSSDPEPFRNYLLAELGNARLQPAIYQSVTANPEHWSGPTARLYRNAPGVFFIANWLPYISATFAKDPFLSPHLRETLHAFEKTGATPEPAPALWQQSSYDHLVSPEGHYLKP